MSNTSHPVAEFINVGGALVAVHPAGEHSTASCGGCSWNTADNPYPSTLKAAERDAQRHASTCRATARPADRTADAVPVLGGGS